MDLHGGSSLFNCARLLPSILPLHVHWQKVHITLQEFHFNSAPPGQFFLDSLKFEFFFFYNNQLG